MGTKRYGLLYCKVRSDVEFGCCADSVACYQLDSPCLPKGVYRTSNRSHDIFSHIVSEYALDLNVWRSAKRALSLAVVICIVESRSFNQ